MSSSSSARRDRGVDRLRRMRQSWRRQPAQVEDSRALRGFVQGLVTVGIASVTIAAIGVAPASALNLLAIPLSALGGYWSWQRRRQANVTTKFVIALGMLAALAVFLGRLLGPGGDTRILLAELLIHLQVLHSFDMPRRKDLGYSAVIGLILLGVAATISQTLTLAPLLLLFLMLALPVLMLDYRSRLGLQSQRSRPGENLPLRRLGGVLLVTVALGLLIFAALPRLPGYQIRNFPVSGTIEFQGEFTGQTILNPGYVSESDDESGDETGTDAGEASGEIQGEGTADGAGQMDETAYYGFNQRMNQNLRGSLEPQVMMRVRSQAPGFWRVLAFDHYTGQGWEVSRDDDVQVLKRSSFSYQTYLPAAAFQPRLDLSSDQQRQVIQTYTVVTPLPNLVPTLYRARELYFPTREVAIDPEGGLRSPVPLSEGLTYTVVSQVPYRDRTALRQAGTDYPESVTAAYLQVPDAIREQLRQQAETLLDQSAQPVTAAYEQALFLAQALKQNYTVQPNLPHFETDEDLAAAFLFKYEGGYPDHFSSVLTLMLRSLGIPARLVVGFGTGEFNPFTGYYVVRNTDAHAMTEVYFPGYGWFAFDPIPGHELVPPSVRRSQTFSVLRQFWNWVAGWLPSPVSGWLSGLFNALAAWVSGLVQLVKGSWWGALAGLMGLTLLGFGGWLLVNAWRAWRRQRWLQQLPAIERIYQQLLRWLAQRGFPKAPAQTPLEYAQQLSRQSSLGQTDQITAILNAYVRWRYGGQPQNIVTLQNQLRSLQRQRRSAPRSERA